MALAVLLTKGVVPLQVGWWTRVPWEAWELMRISSLKTIRAVQTLAKLATQFASETLKHRYAMLPRNTGQLCWLQSLLPSVCKAAVLSSVAC